MAGHRGTERGYPALRGLRSGPAYPVLVPADGVQPLARRPGVYKVKVSLSIKRGDIPLMKMPLNIIGLLNIEAYIRHHLQNTFGKLPYQEGAVPAALGEHGFAMRTSPAPRAQHRTFSPAIGILPKWSSC